MELRIKNYIIRPDNGSTYSLTKILTKKEGEDIGTIYESTATYPRDLKQCLLRIKEDMIREDKSFCQTLDETIEKLKEIERVFEAFVEKAIVDLK